jgi:plastocyanin
VKKNRESLLLPIVIPVIVLAVIGIVLFGFSRILLQLSPTAAWLTALAAAAGVMGVAAYTATRAKVASGSLFSMVGAAAGIAMLAGGVALFVGSKGGEEPGRPIVLIVAPGDAATSGFATTNVAWPAGVPVNLEFDNQDPSNQHNVVIATADPAKDPAAEALFRQPPFIGPKKVTWPVEPLAAGTYFFFCEVHPTTMTGTIEAAEGGGGITVVAKGTAFNTDEISIPPARPTTITLDNQDVGIAHNLSIYADADYTQVIEQTPISEILPGPRQEVFDVPPLDPGTYYFKCDIHPTMAGTVVVAEPQGGPGTPPTGATGSAGPSP